MGLKVLQPLMKLARRAFQTAPKAGAESLEIFAKKESAVIGDVVQISNKRALLKQRLLGNSKIVSSASEWKPINIPGGCRFRAPRPGFDESLKAYKDLIRNNAPEIREICTKYQQGLINEEQFANEYAKFLAEKMNMPYYPKLRQMISETTAGGFSATENIIEYNVSHMSRMSELMQTITHETHHFLQQKEIFSTVSIEKFALSKAKADIEAILKKTPGYCKSKKEKQAKILEQALAYIKKYKDAGWEKVIENYSRNINPNSPYYKRAQQLINADLNYISGTENAAKYMENLIEKEAYEIGTHTTLEIEHVLNTITKEEKEIAAEIYDCLNSPSFRDVSGVEDILMTYNTNPYNIIQNVKEAKKMGLNDAYSIIEHIL